MDLLKKGLYIITVLFLSIGVTSCDDNEVEIDEIQGLDFVIATLNVEGTKIGVLPTTVNSNNRIVYTVDFGATSDSDDDVFQTSGPMVTYNYPNQDGMYRITIEAALEGTQDVSISKDIEIKEYIPPTTGGSGTAILGRWKLAPEAGAIGVGPSLDNVSWWSSSAEDVTTRACLFDDEYVFNADGTFQNVLGSETWVEAWQGNDPEGCAAPVFPHDGTATATYVYNEAAGTVTINGKGAFLGLAKVINGGELSNPGDAADSITYIAKIEGNVMELDIEIAGGGYWSFKLVKPSIVGTWKLAPEAGALGVGPSLNNVSWWSSALEDVTTRACLFDDKYIFNADGTFQNVQGSETWVEAWQGNDPEGCAAPVFPHDGSASATYVFDEAAGTIALNGKGAFLGLAKVINGGELSSPGDAAESITYIALLDGDTLELDIEIDNGGYWSFKLARQ